MPSPIIHTTAGYVIYRLTQKAAHNPRIKIFKQVPVVLAYSIGMSVLPDLDSIPGFLMGDLGFYHNQGFHSLTAGVVMALIAGLAARYIFRLNFWYWFFIGLVSFEGHVLLDTLTIGRGTRLFWPFIPDRFDSSIKLFYGLHWSKGLISIHHLWTLVSESLVVAFVVLMERIITKKSSPIIPDRQ